MYSGNSHWMSFSHYSGKSGSPNANIQLTPYPQKSLPSDSLQCKENCLEKWQKRVSVEADQNQKKHLH